MTPQEAKQKLIDSGVTAAEYARQHGFKYTQVVAVLNGTNKGRYGEAYEIRIALGISSHIAN